MEQNRNAHTIRNHDLPPDYDKLVRENGQATISVAFRKGRAATNYVRFRQWCWRNNVNPSDVFNSIIEPIVHFCENFASRDSEGNTVVVFNLGEVKLEQTYASGNCGYKKVKPKKRVQSNINKVTLI